MSLMIGVVVVVVAGIIGTIIGMLAGYLGGRFDAIAMRFIDFQTAIPYFLLAMDDNGCYWSRSEEPDNRTQPRKFG